MTSLRDNGVVFALLQHQQRNGKKGGGKTVKKWCKWGQKGSKNARFLARSGRRQTGFNKNTATGFHNIRLLRRV